MKKLSALAAIAALMVPVALQAQQTDYLGFNDRAEQVARIVTSTASCKRLGFEITIDEASAKSLAERTVRIGVMDGINKSTAEQLIVAAMDREDEDLAYLSKVPEDIQSDAGLLAHFRETMSFWMNRCRSLAATELGGRYIRVTGSEDQVFENAIAAMAKKLEELPGE